jgi:hypothetical protein
MVLESTPLSVLLLLFELQPPMTSAKMLKDPHPMTGKAR